MTSPLYFFSFVIIVTCLLLAINLLLAIVNPYLEKNSVFECGFHSFLGQNRSEFSISFYIFGLLYLLFDLEILLVYPYITSAYVNGLYGLIVMLIFLVVLTIGFVFELAKKALSIYSRQINNIANNKKRSELSYYKKTNNSYNLTNKQTNNNTLFNNILTTSPYKKEFKSCNTVNIKGTIRHYSSYSCLLADNNNQNLNIVDEPISDNDSLSEDEAVSENQPVSNNEAVSESQPVSENQSTSDNESVSEDQSTSEDELAQYAYDIQLNLGILTGIFMNQASQSLDRQRDKLVNLEEESKSSLDEVLSKRRSDRGTLSSNSLKSFDEETKKIITEQNDKFNRDTDEVMGAADQNTDMFNIIHQERRRIGHYPEQGEPLSPEVMEKMVALENMYADKQDSHKQYTDNLKLQNTAQEYENQDDSSNSSDNDLNLSNQINEPINQDTSILPQPALQKDSTDLGIGSSSRGEMEDNKNTNKRKYDDFYEDGTESQYSSERVKRVDNTNNQDKDVTLKMPQSTSKETSNETSNEASNETSSEKSQDNRSPLDYVLDKQQSEPMDFSDDLD